MQKENSGKDAAQIFGGASKTVRDLDEFPNGFEANAEKAMQKILS